MRDATFDIRHSTCESARSEREPRGMSHPSNTCSDSYVPLRTRFVNIQRSVIFFNHRYERVIHSLGDIRDSRFDIRHSSPTLHVGWRERKNSRFEIRDSTFESDPARRVEREAFDIRHSTFEFEPACGEKNVGKRGREEYSVL